MKYLITKNYWKYNFSFKALASGVVGSFGILWLTVEVSSFFSDTFSRTIKPYWWLFLLIGVLSAIWYTRPKLRQSCRMKAKNSIIEIVVGDLFNEKSSLIISSNNKFITKSDTNSTQAQFVRNLYKTKDVADKAIQEALVPLSNIKDSNGEYPIGTVIKLEPNKDKTVYLVAVARKNSHNKSYTTFEDVQLALKNMWDYFSTQGDLSDLAINLMGTGRAKLPISREKAIKEILETFSSACEKSNFCKKLTIVLSTEDHMRNPVDMNEVGQLLTFYCEK